MSRRRRSVPAEPARPRFPRGRVIALTSLLLLAVAGAWGLSRWDDPWESGESLLNKAQTRLVANDPDGAASLALRAMRRNPELTEAGLFAAQHVRDRKVAQQVVAAISHARPHQPSDQQKLWLAGAELNHHKLFRLSDAERNYRAVLTAEPEHRQANAGLAQLLLLCGRKHDAVPSILQLLRAGEETELLLLLGRVDAVIDDPKLLRDARLAAPDDPNPLLGLAWRAIRDEQLSTAEELVQETLQHDPQSSTAQLMRGRILLARSAAEAARTWIGQDFTAAASYGEAWFLRGQLAELIGQPQVAIRSYWEAARRSPELKGPAFRLSNLLAAQGDATAAAQFAAVAQRLQDLEQIQTRALYSGGPGRPELLPELIDALEANGRLWEAVSFARLAYDVSGPTPVAGLRWQRLQSVVAQAPLQLVLDPANVALTIDLSRFPLELNTAADSPSEALVSAQSAGPITFRDDAAAAGLKFRYMNGVVGTPSRRMYEFTGGGVAALDYDLDGWIDVCLTQGRTWPPSGRDDEHRDHLFRNQSGTLFEDVTSRAGIVESDFGQGATVGDFNADGFPDLYVANIGANRLWLNRGDGTFADVTVAAGLSGEHWTTSVVMADLTGDGLPDLYDANYVMAQDVFNRICRHPDGAPRMCMPFDFEAEPDVFWENAGDGTFHDATIRLDPPPGGMGLGAAVWDAYGAGQLSLLVANDTTPCFFYDRAGTGDQYRLLERGLEAGVALNGDGKATGCMGIALGDVDADGQLDLLITNFLAEPNTFFRGTAPGFFEDQTRAVGLYAPSLDVLGFGTQFLDADLDGRLELLVANGHIDDLSDRGKPHRMLPQLFRWSGQRFELESAARVGPYFEQRWLGRAATRLDWNRDGREDLIVGQLDDPTVLLTNTTSASGRFLALRLIGIASSRDAIGTAVRVQSGGRTQTFQLTAGDGYQCSNERRIVAGLGNSTSASSITVRWPSGTTQEFADVASNAEFVLREGQPLLPLNPDGP